MAISFERAWSTHYIESLEAYESYCGMHRGKFSLENQYAMKVTRQLDRVTCSLCQKHPDWPLFGLKDAAL